MGHCSDLKKRCKVKKCIKKKNDVVINMDSFTNPRRASSGKPIREFMFKT